MHTSTAHAASVSPVYEKSRRLTNPPFACSQSTWMCDGNGSSAAQSTARYDGSPAPAREGGAVCLLASVGTYSTSNVMPSVGSLARRTVAQ